VVARATIGRSSQGEGRHAQAVRGGAAHGRWRPQFNGAKADAIFDSSGGCGNGGLETGTVLPGKTYSYEVAFSVGPQPGEMQLGFEPHFGQDKAVFVGQA
jgi:hypothetical protein